MPMELMRTGAVARPDKLNALKLDMYEDLGRAVVEVRGADAIRAVLLTGAGEKAFCIGTDLTQSIPALASGTVQTIKEAALALQDLPWAEASASEAALGQRTFTSEDARKGLAAFAARAQRKPEKRP